MTADRIKWCCAAFENAYNLAGDRTIAVLIDRYADGEPEFLLQARAFERGHEERLNTSAPISLISESPIAFCPWCGTDLRRRYRSNIDDLQRAGFKIDKGF
ncbi:MAG TPA: hypothetical protein VLV78_21080 [Thermoanaerobaculia bacterium]|nr:hypothetical protein [Thermoanaerobaculia bacterium]